MQDENISNSLITYPCSGRSWVAYMLAMYIYDKPLDWPLKKKQWTRNWPAINPNAPDISHGNSHRIRVKLSHTTRIKAKSSNRAILIRDPRSVMCSYYHLVKYRMGRGFDGTLSEFIRDPRVGMPKYMKFLGFYADNSEWFNSFMIIRYEDLHKDSAHELKRIIDFFNLGEYTEDQLNEISMAASFDNLKAQENKYNEKTKYKHLGDEKYSKFRGGSMTQYKEELSEEDVDYINGMMKENRYYGIVK